MNELNPNEADPIVLWAEIERLRSQLDAPGGGRWMDHAVALKQQNNIQHQEIKDLRRQLREARDEAASYRLGIGMLNDERDQTCGQVIDLKLKINSLSIEVNNLGFEMRIRNDHIGSLRDMLLEFLKHQDKLPPRIVYRAQVLLGHRDTARSTEIFKALKGVEAPESQGSLPGCA